VVSELRHCLACASCPMLSYLCRQIEELGDKTEMDELLDSALKEKDESDGSTARAAVTQSVRDCSSAGPARSPAGRVQGKAGMI
jgi:hypothetical protein